MKYSSESDWQSELRTKHSAYFDWAVALWHFLTRKQTGKVLLAIDNDELNFLASDNGIEATLDEAVRNWVADISGRQSGRDLVGQCDWAVRTLWNGATGIDPNQTIPAYLPILGLCVLAASKMEGRDYYPRLNALLLQKEQSMPPGFENCLGIGDRLLTFGQNGKSVCKLPCASEHSS